MKAILFFRIEHEWTFSIPYLTMLYRNYTFLFSLPLYIINTWNVNVTEQCVQEPTREQIYLDSTDIVGIFILGNK